MALNAYITATQLLLHDTAAQFYSVSSLTSYINTARNRVAADAKCIRVLSPSSASISAVSPVLLGSGYTTAPTATISAPDIITGTQATVEAFISSGHVVQYIVLHPGSGYLTPPTITLSGGGGTGATAVAALSTYVSTFLNQEVYTFASLNPFAQQTPGVASIEGIFSIAVMQGAPGAYKPTLFQWPWGSLQAYCRSYSALVTNYPDRWAQYGQGVNGSFYLYPIPSGTYPMDVDAYCLPLALSSDTAPEAIPYPWTDAVPYYAAYLALLNAQRREDAMNMLSDYRMKLTEGRAFATPPVVPSYYGYRR